MARSCNLTRTHSACKCAGINGEQMSTLAEALCFPLCGNARSPWFLTKALVKPVCHHLRLPRRQLDLREDPLPNFPASLWLPRSEGRRARPTREAAPPAGSRVTEQRTGVDGGDRKVLSVPLALRQRPRPGLTGKRKKENTSRNMHPLSKPTLKATRHPFLTTECGWCVCTRVEV